MKNDVIDEFAGNVLCSFEGFVCDTKDPLTKRKLFSRSLPLINEVQCRPGVLEYLEKIALDPIAMTHKLFVRCEFGNFGPIANKWLSLKDFAKYDGILEYNKVIEMKEREDFKKVCKEHDAHVVVSDKVDYLNHAEEAGVPYLVLFGNDSVAKKENMVDLKKNKGTIIYIAEDFNELLLRMKEIAVDIVGRRKLYM